jgi:hypothetical protein
MPARVTHSEHGDEGPCRYSSCCCRSQPRHHHQHSAAPDDGRSSRNRHCVMRVGFWVVGRGTVRVSRASGPAGSVRFNITHHSATSDDDMARAPRSLFVGCKCLGGVHSPNRATPTTKHTARHSAAWRRRPPRKGWGRLGVGIAMAAAGGANFLEGSLLLGVVAKNGERRAVARGAESRRVTRSTRAPKHAALADALLMGKALAGLDQSIN